MVAIVQFDSNPSATGISGANRPFVSNVTREPSPCLIGGVGSGAGGCGAGVSKACIQTKFPLNYVAGIIIGIMLGTGFGVGSTGRRFYNLYDKITAVA